MEEGPLYGILVHAHSGIRWIVLILLIAAIAQAFSKRNSEIQFNKETGKVALFAFIATHIQLVIGLILYLIIPRVQFVENTMSDAVLRFHAVEHISTMILGIILITVGYSKAKRSGSFNTIFWMYLIGLILILSRIPWPIGPFAKYGGGWF